MIEILIHTADEGGYWAEVPALPGCMTQGATYREVLINLADAMDGWLATQQAAIPQRRKRHRSPSSKRHGGREDKALRAVACPVCRAAKGEVCRFDAEERRKLGPRLASLPIHGPRRKLYQDMRIQPTEG